MGIMTIIFVLIDLVSKYIVSVSMELNARITIIDNFLYFTYVRNTGVAFSMFPNNRYLVLIMSLLIIIGIIGYVYKNRPDNNLEKVGYSLILGGAIGNFINRMVNGYVTDFVDTIIFNYDYPIFNLADTFIVIGVIILLIYTWRCKHGNKR